MTYSRLLKQFGGARLLAAVLSAFAVTHTASAQQTINLTAIDGYPVRAMWVKEFSEYFIPEVDKRLAAAGNKYKIRWNQAWGGQIVKPGGVLEGLKRGLGDIGVVTTPFHTDKVPMQALAYVTPFISTDPLLVARTLDKLAQQFPEMKQEFAEQGQVYLATGVVLDSYQLFSKTAVKQLSDFQGLKVNGAGTNLRYLDGLGATGVAGPLTTYYNNIQTGVVSGAFLWTEAAVSFKLAEVAPNMLKADLGAVNTKVVTANAESWKRLPDDVKKVIQEVAVAYRDRLAKIADEKGKSSEQGFTKAGGTINVMSEQQRLAWAKGMPNLAKEWAASMDGKGKPGSKVLAAYMDALRKDGAKPLRNWDRE
ncbi:MAG: C4-dicarboxylate TRAP transporter substrate-binding protein [Betaproteobacteria bacterium]|jgi:C4-dicarboxylate-binding protein DctP|nr:C4-dicarboxylate TRAP transporter substrate-binding protein [Betaproteobacteria bacterium]MDH5343157.1 C4-dicarboxylate TRAP transporter substrate-binding protein [Betaproteobacteria bacterium]